jgi:type 1 fimbriae regulatory protein FimB
MSKIIYLEPDEFRDVLLHAPERHRLWMLMAFYHGLRVSEVLSIMASDIADGKLVVRRGKKSYETTQSLIRHGDPVLDEAHQVEERLRSASPDKSLFNIGRCQAWRIFRAAVLAAGLPRTAAHPHVAKHSCAMAMIASGATINDVQARLGHKSVTSTAKYLHANDRTADRAASKAFGGLS